MYGLSEDKWIEWQKKRRNTRTGFFLVCLVIGIDCSIVDSTLYLYLKDLVKVKKPDIWYGVILAVFFVSSTVCGAISGRLIDKTRKMGIYVKISLIVQIIGFLVYVIHLQPICLLVGRILCGVADPFNNVVTGEILRIYNTEESMKNMLNLSAMFSLGFIVGPAFNFLFKKIDFSIGPVEINYTNFCGIFMAAILLILLVITHFLIHDCSLEFNLKEHLKQASPDDLVIAQKCDNSNSVDNDIISNENIDATSMVNDDDIRNGHCDESLSTAKMNSVVKYTMSRNDPENLHFSIVTDPDIINRSNLAQNDVQLKSDDITKRQHTSFAEEEIPVILVIKTLLTNIDTLIIFGSTFFLMYALTAFTMYIPILIYETMKWSLQTYSIILLVAGVFDFIFLALMGQYCSSNHSAYIAALICIFGQIVACGVLLCFKFINRKNSTDISLLAIYLITITLGWCFDDVLIPVFLGNLVPSSIQSFVETLRGGTCRMSMIFGSLTTGVMSPWLHIWSAVVASIVTIILFAFLLRRRHFINPQELPFTNIQFVSA